VLKALAGLVIVVSVALVLAMAADFFLNRPKPGPAPADTKPRAQAGRPEEKRPTVTKKKTRQPEPPEKSPGQTRQLEPPEKSPGQTRPAVTKVFEVFDDEPEKEKPHREPVPVPEDSLPRVAIIIDDIGFDRAMAKEFAALDRDITLAVLPGSPHGESLARSLHAGGMEIMLHQPMEPMEYPEVDPGPGAILSSMGPDEVIERLRRNLSAIPGVSGVNNHMGSRLTTLEPVLNQVFSVLKKEGLFFVDSRTSRDSVCRHSARLLQVPFAQRDVFLDNIQEPDYIRGQLRELADIARRHGTAIGIGHPYRATCDVLREELEAMKGKVSLVRASTLTDLGG
jgi:polysaccharide deacetylase 2 family uncharacterized protein YibQ